MSEDLRLRIVYLQKAGKGYKSISKSLDVHESTVKQIVYKWRKFRTVATRPRSGGLAKMTARAQRRMLNEVKKNPRVSAKDRLTSLLMSLQYVKHCKVWWRKHHGLLMLCCLRAWTACYHRHKNIFPSLSRHFAGGYLSAN